jgi:tetratricopeptide (TPR) repeat protein
MVEGTIAAVDKHVEAGLSLEKILAERPLAPWAEWERADFKLSCEGWTREIHASLTDSKRLSISAPLTEVLVASGTDEMLKTYHRLRKEEPDNWNFDENQLNMLGYQLLQRNMVEQAIEVFKLNVEIFPEASNPYDSLGEGYMTAGHKELAITNYERSLELNPDNDNAVRMLERLRNE